jgi:hypothetical protein
MQEFVYEDLFTRTFGYLRQSGIALTRETALAALKMIEEILVTDSRDALDRAVVELPRRLEAAESPLPVPSPPVNRGSIGYR